jgi:hypothetical protein
VSRRIGVKQHLMMVAYQSSTKEKTIQKARNELIFPT